MSGGMVVLGSKFQLHLCLSVVALTTCTSPDVAQPAAVYKCMPLLQYPEALVSSLNP